MLDPNKSVVIFSHPRSGSTWFQKSLPQYNLNELFLLQAEISGFYPDRVSLTYKEKNTYEDPAKELQRRFDIYTDNANQRPVSVKIHTLLINEQITDFIRKQDTQYILLNRRNKLDTFWSAIIAWHTLNWHSVANPINLTVTRTNFDDVILWMKNHEVEREWVKSLFDVTELYFEDYINYPKSDWFSPHTVLIQNAKSVTTIDNLDEVNQWIYSNDFLREKLYPNKD
jgi:hypothetical protein